MQKVKIKLDATEVLILSQAISGYIRPDIVFKSRKEDDILLSALVLQELYHKLNRKLYSHQPIKAFTFTAAECIAFMIAFKRARLQEEHNHLLLLRIYQQIDRKRV